MILRDAKNVARQWVAEASGATPGFLGAFFHGSSNWLADDTELPATSDLDVMLVLDDANPPVKPGKFIYRGVMLEISYLPVEQVRSVEVVLGDYRLAGSFHTASVIADPTGRLTALQMAVARDYPNRDWVRTRCEQARENALHFLGSVDAAAPLHEQATGWLFGAGVTTHVLLVAGLKNPTVRKRYLAARELLEEYGRLDFHERLLELLGCAQWTRTQAEDHLAELAHAFDAAKTVIKTPYFFASDLSDLARPIAIDGSREMIANGFHREAVFWLVATSSRCQAVFAADAPDEMRERFEPDYLRLLNDLGITSPADLRVRRDQVIAALPGVWAVAETIMAANPEISG
jgi:hypothetical protein